MTKRRVHPCLSLVTPISEFSLQTLALRCLQPQSCRVDNWIGPILEPPAAANPSVRGAGEWA